MLKATENKKLKVLAQHKVLLLGLCVLYVLRPTFVEWIKSYVCPLTPTEIDNNGWVLAVIIVAVILCYIVHLNRLLNERKLFVSRYITLVLLFGGWCIFRYANEFDFYAIDEWKLNYIECAWVTIGAIEIGLFIKRFVVWCLPDGESHRKPFLADAPAIVDEMGREKYARQLIQKIKSVKTEKVEGALTILLNEHYGVGKTSFMLQLQQMAEAEQVDVCWFKPWLYEDSKTTIINFIRVIQEKIGDGDKSLQKMLNRYARTLSSIEKFEWLSVFQTDDSSIETQFEDIKAKLQKLKRPIIVLIDDVDRLQSEELLRMIQMVRNMGDFPYLYYIIAGDKVAIEEALAGENLVDPDEYLKKFFNLEICFPADDGRVANVLQKGLESIIGRYGKKSDVVWDFIQKLRYGQEVFDNIRDIKRYLNVLDYALSNCQAEQVDDKTTMLDEISLRDLAGICMIQYIDSEFYRMLRDHNERILEYKNWHYQVKSDYSTVFTDRNTKEWIEKVASQTTNGKSEAPNMKKELEEKVKTLSDFIRWSKPKKKEVIGELLEILFPHGMTEGSKIGVCHPTEYFKYFSTAYRKTDMSNAEIIGIMEMDGADFMNALEGIRKGNKSEAFKHKLKWYMQTQIYDRLTALKKVMTAYEMEQKKAEKWKSSEEDFFMRNYGASMLAAFWKREGDTERQTMKAWNELREWLITTDSMAQRIYVLNILTGHVDNHSSYVFGSRSELLDCVKASEKEYVENVWAKDRYNPKVYQYISWYKDIDKDIADLVIKEIKRRKCNVGFLHHLLEYKKGVLQWNDHFIESVLWHRAVFQKEGVNWLSIVPLNWREEFKKFYMQNPLKDEEIVKSDFLMAARDYWRAEMELNGREKERLVIVAERGPITAKQYIEQFKVSEGVARKELNKYVRLGYMAKEKIGTRVNYVVPTNEIKFES